jgi:hypothetical protein
MVSVTMLASELTISVDPASCESLLYRRPNRTPKKPDGKASSNTAARAVSELIGRTRMRA